MRTQKLRTNETSAGPRKAAQTSAKSAASKKGGRSDQLPSKGRSKELILRAEGHKRIAAKKLQDKLKDAVEILPEWASTRNYFSSGSVAKMMPGGKKAPKLFAQALV